MNFSGSENVEQLVSTGRLPGWAEVESLAVRAYERYRGLDDGVVADYIPALANVDPELFGLVVSEVNGSMHDSGDATYEF